MLIAQITDTHIRPEGRLAYRTVDTAAFLAATVAHIVASPDPIDAVIATGDLVDFGTAEEYARFRALIRPIRVPVLPLPGNHDHPEAFRAAFADLVDLPAEGDLSYATDLGRLRFVMLDSTVPGRPHGEMTPDRLAWLERTLAEAPGRPTLLAMHHPPFLTGIRHMDVQNCFNGAALERVVERHPQVLALACGHVHRTVVTTFAGRAASIARSTAHSVSLALGADAAPSFHMEPVGLHLHAWRPEPGPHGSLVTHVASVGAHAGPYPFFDRKGALID